MGIGQTKTFISASNNVTSEASAAANNTAGSNLLTNLSMIDRIKIISTIAKSEMAMILTSQQASELSN